MNVTKKVIALIVIAVIIIRAFTIETFALAGAPVIAAEELATLLETALVGMGLNADDLDGKDYNDLMDEFKIQMSTNPNFNPKKTVQYPKPEYVGPGFLTACLMDLLTKPEVQAGIGVSNAILSSIADDVISDFFSDYTKLSDSVVPTPTVDLKGHGALFVRYRPDGTINYRCYCDYISLNGSAAMLHGKLHYVYYLDGKILREEDRDMGDSFVGTTTSSICKYYGDVRNHLDGTQVETDDEAIPVIGEADGTQVTPDMLNPDGTVTIDGTTYYPKDFIDWDKFKDPAIIDLLNQILSKIDDIDVIEPDTTKDLVDSITDSVDISVSEELSDYMMPTGISSVFPFCLPFDLYRGIKLLSVKPVAPVLEIPFEVPEFGLFKGYKTTLTIEFEKYDKYFSVFRWGTYLIFAFGLIFITTKIVKGANE